MRRWAQYWGKTWLYGRTCPVVALVQQQLSLHQHLARDKWEEAGIGDEGGRVGREVKRVAVGVSLEVSKTSSYIDALFNGQIDTDALRLTLSFDKKTAAWLTSGAALLWRSEKWRWMLFQGATLYPAAVRSASGPPTPPQWAQAATAVTKATSLNAWANV